MPPAALPVQSPPAPPLPAPSPPTTSRMMAGISDDHDDEDNVVSSAASIIKCSREEFSEEQLVFMYSEFYDIIEKKSKKTCTEAIIKSRLNRNSLGKSIYNAFSLFKIKNKIKYLKSKEKAGKNVELAQLARQEGLI